MEGAVRHYELKADQLAQLSENAKAVYREELAAHSNRLLTARAEFEKRKAELTKEELAKVEAEEKQRAAEERLSDELRKIRNEGRPRP